MALDRSGLLAALATRFEDVKLAAGTVRVRTMTAGERIDVFSTALGADGKVDNKRFAALLIESCVVDDNGTPLFTSADTDTLLASAADVFETLFEACQSINGMGAKAAEAAAGN